MSKPITIRNLGSAVGVGFVMALLLYGPWSRTIPQDAFVQVVSVNGLGQAGTELFKSAVLGELERRGYREPSSLATRASYGIDIVVVVMPEEDDMVPVSIFWIVSQSVGKRVGTVEQSNRLPASIGPEGVFEQIVGPGITAGTGGIVDLLSSRGQP